MRQFLSVGQALSDESRLRILMCLDGSILCLAHLTQILDLGASTVSKHLRVLTEAGLLRAWQEGRWRFYQWAEATSDPHIALALNWVRESLADDPVVQADAARRAVALQTCPAPCPQVAVSKVLFLCTGNSCRSQMAEGLLRKHGGEAFEVFSAGLDPRPIPREAFEVMAEIGIDISAQRPKNVLDFLGREHFGYLITVCPNAEARCPIFPGVSQRLYWPFEDPAGAAGGHDERLAKFRDVRDQIETRILSWLQKSGGSPRAPGSGRKSICSARPNLEDATCSQL